MPTIDLNVNFDDVKDEDRPKPIPPGTYPFTILSWEKLESGETSKNPGRPYLVWQLAVEVESGKTRRQRFMTMLPWPDPVTGEVIITGVGNLVGLCKAVGKPWTGSAIDPDEYVNLSGVVRIKQVPARKQNEAGQWVDDQDAPPTSDVAGFEY